MMFRAKRPGVWCRDRRDETLYLVNIRVNVNNELLLIFQISSFLLSISWAWEFVFGLNKIIYMASNIVPVHILLSRNRILWEIARPASKCTSRDDRNLPKGMSGNTMARRKDQIYRWHFN
ncbi:hypothetical protein CJF30_00005605 [Rutstroemia sp. NJR-2017a BBW]|nr:hypothetical protein CJF30_00005778 [Rutstroemia sp. NJR-2017a BBW]PQE08737.1 hypothetical protein CJF30_00005605 [Rutstroemia sp. NJR-2017a BBW]